MTFVDSVFYFLPTETYTIETEASEENYNSVNEEPLQLEHALLEVTSGCNGHIALLHRASGAESEVIYEILLGRTSDSAIIVHASEQTKAMDDALEVFLSPLLLPIVRSQLCHII